MFGMRLRRVCLCRCGLVRNTVHPNQFPWVVIVHTGVEFLQGTLISDQHILTAAAPLFGVPHTNITVALGVYDRCEEMRSLNSSISEVSVYPGFSPSTWSGNLALLKTRYPVNFNNYISPICLPILELKETGHEVWTPVWHLNSERPSCVPRVAISPLLPTSSCVGSVDKEILTPDKGCFDPLAANNAICEMDIGTPVQWRWSTRFPFRLIGVVSSTPSCVRFEFDPNITTLYTNINEYLPWIFDHIRNDCNCL